MVSCTRLSLPLERPQLGLDLHIFTVPQRRKAFLIRGIILARRLIAKSRLEHEQTPLFPILGLLDTHWSLEMDRRLARPPLKPRHTWPHFPRPNASHHLDTYASTIAAKLHLCDSSSETQFVMCSCRHSRKQRVVPAAGVRPCQRDCTRVMASLCWELSGRRGASCGRILPETHSGTTTLRSNPTKPDSNRLTRV